jgi:alkylation response protein AidB-like acyl-CoA dehydrogenase
MYSLHLSAEQLEFRDMIRDFVTQEVKPVAIRSERLEPFEQPLLTGLLEKASSMGLRTMALSEDNGGSGADALTGCIVAEELAVGDVDIAAVLSETSALSHILFDRLMSPAQRERFLPTFTSDERFHLAFANREPETDTRIGVGYHQRRAEGRIATKAARAANGDWVLHGTKSDVVNAPVAKLFIVSAEADVDGKSGPHLFIVPAGAPSLMVRAQPQASRSHHGTAGDVTFADCHVPAGNLLAADGNAAALLSEGRLHDLAINIGIGRAAYEAALEYSGIRVQGAKRIIEHQATATRLADIAISLDVARNAVWRAAYASDHPDAVSDRSLPDLPLAAMARVFTSTVVYRAAKDAAELFGAMGVMRDMPLQKYIHDAFICLRSGDGNADAKLRIAETLAGIRPA